MIYELFNFYNEFDMLEMKLQEHYQHVDRFIICESNRSSTQVPKEYRLKKELDSRYAQWRDKITLLEFDAAGLESGWPTLNAQRNYQIKNQNFNPNDILLFSDLDEFLLPTDWQWIKEQKIAQVKNIVRFESELFWCYANMLHSTKNNCIAMATGAILKSPAELRKQNPEQISKPMPADWIIKKGGVHLSWFVNEEQMKEKIHGNIEAHSWSKSLNKSKEEIEELYWKQKKSGKLFEHKEKFKLRKIKKISLEDNTIFTDSMKAFIKKHPEWLFLKN
jgi:hypothetical protein